MRQASTARLKYDSPAPENPKPRGRPKSADAGNRVHLNIPESLTQRIQEIQRVTHAASMTEVVKAALILYSLAVEEHQNGGHVYLRREDGPERQVALFI